MRIGQTIYLDHQATTPLDKRVASAMLPYLDGEFGNPHSADHVMGWAATKAVEAATHKISSCLNVSPDEIIYTSGATEANNLAILGIARREIRSNRRRILCSSIEHKSVLEVCRVARDQLGFEVETIPVDPLGHVVLSNLERMLDDTVLLVSIMAVNNEIGTVQRIEQIGERVASAGGILHCDAAQAPCAFNIMSIAQVADMLSISGHKIYGPKGIGVLVARRSLHSRIEPMIYGGGQQDNLRSGTVPVPLCVGLGKAVELLSGEEGLRERALIQTHRDQLIDLLSKLKWKVCLNGPLGSERHPGNVNVSFEGFAAQDILGALQPRLAASTGSACTSGITEPSHVLRAIGMSAHDADSAIRFSIGRYTTPEEIDEAVCIIDQVLSRLNVAAI